MIIQGIEITANPRVQIQKFDLKITATTAPASRHGKMVPTADIKIA